MSNYIRIVMKDTQSGGGIISARASFKLDNLTPSFENVEVKIDTGCVISTIPLAKFKASMLCSDLKRYDVENNTEYLISYGVETGGEKHNRPQSNNDKMKCEALKFKHGISNFKINGVDILCDGIYVNYDRKSNILIGMDILKNWDIHIGKSSAKGENGKVVFLACPYGRLNDDYLKELDRTFSFTTAVLASSHQ